MTWSIIKTPMTKSDESLMCLNLMCLHYPVLVVKPCRKGLDKRTGTKYQREGVRDLSNLLNFLVARGNKRFCVEQMLDGILDLFPDLCGS